MAEDGRIIIDTKINSDGIEKGEKELRAKLSKMARNLDLKVNIKSNAVDVLKEKINGLNDVINKNRDIMSKGFGVSLDDFIKARDKVKSAEESLNSYKSILSSSSNELNKLKIQQEAYNRTLSQMKTFSIPEIKTTQFEKANKAISNLLLEMENTIRKNGLGYALTYSFVSTENAVNRLASSIKSNLVSAFSNVKQAIMDIPQNTVSAFNNIKQTILNIPNIIAKMPSNIITSFLEMARSISGVLSNVFGSVKEIGFTNIISSTKNSIEKLASSIGINLTSASKKASKAIFNMLTGIPSMVNAAKSAFGGLASAISSLGSRLLSIFSYQVLRQIIRQIIKEFMQGIADLEVYSSRFGNTMQSMKDSLKNLGNSIVTAFAPIIQAVAPALNFLMAQITKLFNTISMFTGALFTNAKTVTVADTSFSGYGKKVEKVGKATKKAKKDTNDMMKALAKFDKLDVLKKDKKKADIGGGVASAVPEVNPATKMFKEVQVPDGILRLVESIKKTFEPLTEFFKEVGNSFLTSFVNPVISHFKDNFLPRFASNFSKFIGEFNFEPLKNALDNLFKALAPLANLAMDGLNWGLENIIYPMLKWTGEAYMPAVINMISSAVQTLTKAIEVAEPILKKIYEEEIKPLFEYLGSEVIDIINKIKEWLDAVGKWLEEHPDELEAMVKTLWDVSKALLAIWGACKLILGLIALFELITSMDVNKWIILGILLAIAAVIYLINRYGKQWLKWFEDIKQKCSEWFDNFKEWLSDNFKQTPFYKFLEAIKKLIKVIVDLFKGDWKQAWEDAKECIKLMVKGALQQLKLIPDVLVGCLNGAIKLINSLIDGLNLISFGDFKVNIPKIPLVPYVPDNFGIPGLATGTVVSPGREFLARLGDNTREQEIVSPISTMKQAFSEALREYGGGGGAVLQLDGETFARLINPYSKAENNRLGMSMVSGV